MPLVSVLMNCYNGEEYLNEALDSVFAQTFEDWEIVFIDNCSTDKSVEIAKSYGDRVKIFSTERNIPLGAARNLGISKCDSKYIAFLDVDDIWFENTLNNQVAALENSGFALVYGGHVNINSHGDVIGKMLPTKKSGYILSNLLVQYDIPIVTSMVRKQVLIDYDLNFDGNVFASEEYCLFMELAINNQILVIDGFLTKYRIHDDALTNKSISKWADERRYTLNKVISLDPEIAIKYKKEIRHAFARAGYYDSQYYMSISDYKNAIMSLKPFRFISFKYFLLYFILKFFPFSWNMIQNIKYRRTI